MPRGDRTGPEGSGPKTGRGAGYCAGYAQPGFMTSRDGGMGFGRRLRGRGGGGFGRGYSGYVEPGTVWAHQPGSYYPAPPTPREEGEYLRDRANALEHELSSIKQRLSEFEEDSSD